MEWTTAVSQSLCQVGERLCRFDRERPVLMADDWAASLVRIQKRNNIREKRHA
jgi:hypothetical protein